MSRPLDIPAKVNGTAKYGIDATNGDRIIYRHHTNPEFNIGRRRIRLGITARDWQLKKDGKQWMVGKTFDTFAPTGPVLVTADEVRDPHQLPIRLRLNGQTMQDSNTSQMIFSVGETLAYLSQVFTLEPGDLIFTGTPSGVGSVRKPRRYLTPGEVIRTTIEGIGELANDCVSA